MTPELPPNSGLRQLAKTDKLETHKEKIIQYLVNAGEGTDLSDKQKELLARWEFADETLRREMGKSNRSSIAQLIVSKFKVSLATAKSDIVCAEEVFSSSNPLNKKHRILLRIEFLEEQSEYAALAGDYKAVAMIEKSLSFYLDKYPDVKLAKPRRQVVYNIQNNILNDFTIADKEAEDILQLELKRLSDIEIDDAPLSDPENETLLNDDLGDSDATD
jgi:ABC-type uncharacterized transport system fused permease/ATPase subunit